MNSIAAKLTNDHVELDALLRRLAQDAQAPVPGALQATWSELESKLIRHMQAEEQFLLPLLEASDAAEVARIRLEHAHIRDALTELGLAVELHTVREANILELIELLEAHAKHENGALYRLAGDKASAAVEHRIGQLLKHGVAVATSVLAHRGADAEHSKRRARP
ncbi:MAG TPA: hemerythrin domain-containing protein [Polyangiaceae bacterium]|nr:hemerythrin domain-containing protein [Polyangiaceae bacterium]